MIAESPTRPTRLPIKPPVEGPAARNPPRSTAAAPTAPAAAAAAPGGGRHRGGLASGQPRGQAASLDIRDQRGGVAEGHAALAGEAERTLADEQDVLTLLEDAAGEADRGGDAGDGADGARGQAL